MKTFESGILFCFKIVWCYLNLMKGDVTVEAKILLLTCHRVILACKINLSICMALNIAHLPFFPMPCFLTLTHTHFRGTAPLNSTYLSIENTSRWLDRLVDFLSFIFLGLNKELV